MLKKYEFLSIFHEKKNMISEGVSGFSRNMGSLKFKEKWKMSSKS